MSEKPYIPLNVYRPPQTAAEAGVEFNPNTEAHHFGFIVKLIDPGCTIEVQIEERSGRVTRITTTENPDDDRLAINRTIFETMERMFKEWGI